MTTTCFKYRTPEAALRCLKDQTLYFAPPETLNDTLEARYDHADPGDFIAVMRDTYSAISQQRGGPALSFDDSAADEVAAIYHRECERLATFTRQILEYPHEFM